jgi:site-specific DNA recombinase
MNMRMKAKKISDRSAVAYIRVSTKRQDVEGYSPESQRAAIEAYAKKEGLDIREVFEETKSGFNNLEARARYYAMLAFIGEKKICHVIYKFADRVARNLPDFVKLESLGVHMHNLERGKSFNPSDPDDYQATADEERRIVSAKEESARTRKKVKDAVRLMVKKGDYPGAVPPLGYRRNPLVKIGIKKRAGQVEIDPVAGPLVKKMFLLYRTGEYDYRSLAKKMYDLGLRSRKNYFVNHARIAASLILPFYIGRFRWGGETSPMDASYEPLISKELFEECENVRTERSQHASRGGRVFKYQGLRCALCGCTIVGEERHKTLIKSGRAASYVYYHCNGAKGKCGLGWFKEEELDRYFSLAFGHFQELTMTPDIYDHARRKLEEDYQSSQASSREELDGQRRELANIEARGRVLNEHLLSGAVQPDAYQELRDGLAQRRAECEARIAELEAAEENFVDFACQSLKLVSDFKISYLQGNTNIRRRLNTLLFKTISLEPKRAAGRNVENSQCLKIVYNEPFSTLFEEYKTWFLEQEEMAEEYFGDEKNEWRGRRDSNSRPPA